MNQGVADGGNRNGTADVIGQKQDYFPQENRIGNLALPTTFFALQYVSYNNGRIDTIKQCQRLFLVQADISNTGHSSEAHIGIKNLTQLITFARLIISIGSCST